VGVVRLALCGLALLGLVASAPPEATSHLLQGARHFREGRFAQALVEFKVARRLGVEGEADWYIAASLVKLGRAEEALEAFAAAQQSAPESRDALLDYYHALACHEARLYLCADALLGEVGESSGPRIGAQVRKLRADIAALFRAPPAPSSIDWYHGRAAEARAAGRPLLAGRYLEEAARLAERREDRHRLAEARAGLAALAAQGPAESPASRGGQAEPPVRAEGEGS
jgi:tetratricopeptide (TPR) repeat protein